ncbi:glycerate kinase type-2 family protein [Desulfomonile tiedjei]|nr:glycerate kinase [Desulfomonile tiedjei]
MKNMKNMRNDALAIFNASLEAVDPEKAVHKYLKREGDLLRVPGESAVDLRDYEEVLVVGAGKASAAMAKAVGEILYDRRVRGVICVKYGHELELDRIDVIQAGHPVPDEEGTLAAREIMRLASEATARHLIISCISGGGSALLPAPPPGISLDEKQYLTKRLLEVGADIHEMNSVRKHLSLVKGGRLMKAAFPARVINLMLSDVVGDDPGVIASGPFAPDNSTFQDALRILQKYDMMKDAPESVLSWLKRGVSRELPDTPKSGDPIFSQVTNIIVGSNIQALIAGKHAAEALGYNTLILSSSVQGNTAEAALLHGAIAREISASENPVSPPACILSGGETTVQVRGPGKGGRNQEFALLLIEAAAQIPNSLFFSAGTDGTDGPTDAAGALVESSSLERARLLHLYPEHFLARNDSYHFFSSLGDLIKTGPTRTNVMDVRIVLVR